MTLVLLDEPLLGIIPGDLVLNADSAPAALLLGHTETGAAVRGELVVFSLRFDG